MEWNRGADASRSPGAARRAVGGVILAFAYIAFSLNAVAAQQSAAAADRTLSLEQPLVCMDTAGRRHHPGQSRGCRAVVFIFLATQCPISNGCIPELNRVAREFGNLGAEFYGVIFERAVTREQAARHRRKFQVGFPVLFDASGELAQRLRPTHTPEAIVLNGDLQVVYRGAIDDQYADLSRKRPKVCERYMREAVAAAVVGTSVEAPYIEPVGCLLEGFTDGASSGDVTFTRDIAPIVYGHCAGCHRPGEVAPFPLLSYTDVSRRARQVALVAERRIMPPWKAVPGYGQFKNRRGLSRREIELLKSWAKAGAPRGDAADLPPRPKFADGWQLGAPDLIVKIPEPFDVPADGPDIYQHFVMPSHQSEDRLIAAMEFRPSAPAVVHHAIVYFDTDGDARRLDAEHPGPGYARFGGPGFVADGSLGGWGPGGVPRRLPEGMGRLMPAGSDFVVQIHYHPNGKPERDQSRIGIYFAPKSASRLVGEIIVCNVDLSIPAEARRHRHRASYTVPVDTLLLDATPHMHLLGKEMKVWATTPNGRTIPLVWVKDWDFNWQESYVYEEPVRLPAGTRIDVEAIYDNSADNPQNPNVPPRPVDFGELSDDEMGICYFQATTNTYEDFVVLFDDVRRFYEGQLQRYLRRSAQRR